MLASRLLLMASWISLSGARICSGQAWPSAPGAEMRGLAKVSTDISLVGLRRSDPGAFALADLIMRGVSAGLEQYLQERPLFREVCPDQELFVMPIFNLQRYAPGEGFRQWHCDWTISDEATEPGNRVLAWVLYCGSVEEAGTGFHVAGAS